MNPNTIAAVQGYDTVQEQWFTRSSMPTPRGALGAATSTGLLHAIGGFGVTQPLTTHEVYESANDTWSTAAPLPTPRATLAVVTGSDGLIYAIGGSDGTNALTTVEAYAPDKCYPIEHQIALVGKQLIAAESGLAEIPPQARAGAQRELAALRAQIAALEAQLKECPHSRP
jgi:hypothetical protein